MEGSKVVVEEILIVAAEKGGDGGEYKQLR
jgi:hypothetical protein